MRVSWRPVLNPQEMWEMVEAQGESAKLYVAALRKIRAADNMTCVWHIADAALLALTQEM